MPSAHESTGLSILAELGNKNLNKCKFQLVDHINASPWQIRETNMRLGIGFAVMFFYLLIGAVVFVRIEGPAEDRDMETYEEFRANWNKVLMEAGFDGVHM